MSTSSEPDPSSGPARPHSGGSPSRPEQIRRSGADRGLLIAASITLAFGFTAFALGMWFNDATASDGTGANIGAGLLALFGGMVGAAGVIMLLVVASSALVTGSRRWVEPKQTIRRSASFHHSNARANDCTGEASEPCQEKPDDREYTAPNQIRVQCRARLPASVAVRGELTDLATIVLPHGNEYRDQSDQKAHSRERPKQCNPSAPCSTDPHTDEPMSTGVGRHPPDQVCRLRFPDSPADRQPNVVSVRLRRNCGDTWR